MLTNLATLVLGSRGTRCGTSRFTITLVPSPARRRRPRGNVYVLPSGSIRVTVYGGRHRPADRQAAAAARDGHATRHRGGDRARGAEGAHQTAEPGRRASQPADRGDGDQLLDRWLDVIDIEKKTRAGYVGKIEKHIRPTLGQLAVGKVKVETIEALYAHLRRCRDHCRGRSTSSTAPRPSTSATSTPPGGSAPGTSPVIPAPCAAGATGPASRTGACRCRPGASG